GPKLVGAAGAAQTPAAGYADRPLAELRETQAGRDLVFAGRDVIMPPEPSRRAPPPEPTAGMPPDPIPHFVGREYELRELRQQLMLRKRVVVHGLSGVGKTQLAIGYLDRHEADYPDGRFWLRAEQSSTLLSDLASLAWRLQLPERELPEQERQIEAVLSWL